MQSADKSKILIEYELGCTKPIHDIRYRLIISITNYEITVKNNQFLHTYTENILILSLPVTRDQK